MLIREEVWQAAKADLAVDRWDEAIFAAWRHVEAAIQSRIGSSKIGGGLIDEAFDDSSPVPLIQVSPNLKDDTRNLKNLFKGGLGFFKGDRSHKQAPAVPCPDRQTCIRILAFVSLLYDLLDLDSQVAPVIVAVRGEDNDVLSVEVLRSSPDTEILADGVKCTVISMGADTIQFRMPPTVTVPAKLMAVNGRRRSQPFLLDYVPASGRDANFHQVAEVGLTLFDTKSCVNARPQPGVVLRNYESGRFYLSFFPTAKQYSPGDYVDWQWDSTQVVQDSWLKRGKSVIRAFSSASVFAGDVVAHKGRERLSGIEIRPSRVRVRPGDRVPVRVFGFYSDGPASWRVDLTNRTTLEVTDNSIATVGEKHVLTGLAPGITQLRAHIDELYDQTSVVVAPLAAGEVTEFISGFLNPVSMAVSVEGLLFTNRTPHVTVLSGDLDIRILTTLEVPETVSVGPDSITADASGNLYMRTLWDGSIIRLDRDGGYTKMIRIARAKPYTAFMGVGWTAESDLVMSSSDGTLMRWSERHGERPWLRLPVAAVAFASTVDWLWCIHGGGAPGFTRISWDGKTVLNEPARNELPSPGCIYARANDVLIADFHSGRLYSVTNAGASLIAEGLINPSGLAQLDDGSIVVANFGSDTISRILS